MNRVRGAYPNEGEGLYVHLGDLLEYLAERLDSLGRDGSYVTALLVDLGAKLESA